MPTLRERVEQKDRASFIGRQAELAIFDSILDRSTGANVVHVSGPAGIGKSTLLREVARRARDAGYAIRWLEGRDLPPFPEALEKALGDLAESAGIHETPQAPGNAEQAPLLIVLDSYELVGSLDGHLRAHILPTLPESTILILSGRTKPGRAWFDGGWDAVSRSMEVEGLERDDAIALVRQHGVEDKALQENLIRRFGGSPLALSVSAQTGASGSMADLVDRLLGGEADPRRARALGVAALARITTPELLEAVLASDDPHDNYKWLADRSFAELLADGHGQCVLHGYRDGRAGPGDHHDSGRSHGECLRKHGDRRLRAAGGRRQLRRSADCRVLAAVWKRIPCWRHHGELHGDGCGWEHHGGQFRGERDRRRRAARHRHGHPLGGRPRTGAPRLGECDGPVAPPPAPDVQPHHRLTPDPPGPPGGRSGGLHPHCVLPLEAGAAMQQGTSVHRAGKAEHPERRREQQHCGD